MSRTVILDPKTGRVIKSPPPKLRVWKSKSIKPGKVEWLWRGFIPKDEVTMCAGRGGIGKTVLLFDLIARLSRGGKMPGEDVLPKRKPVKCLAVLGEDHLTNVAKPRLAAAGENAANVRLADGTAKGDDVITAMEDLADALEPEITARGIEFVGIDPFIMFIDGDLNSATDVRKSLNPLIRLARKTKCAIFLNHHMNKGNGKRGANPEDAAAGSAQISAGVRTLLTLEEALPGECVLHVAKSNLARKADPLLMRLKSDLKSGQPVVEWDAPSGEHLEALEAKRAGRGAPASAEAVRELVEDGHQPLREIVRDIASQLGASMESVKGAITKLVANGELHEGRDTTGRKTIGTKAAPIVRRKIDAVIAAWKANPKASASEIARKADCGLTLAKRHRPKRKAKL